MTALTTVLYPITDLSRDGAQRQLLELVNGMDKKRFRPVVLSLHSGGAMIEEFTDVPGVKVITLEHDSRLDCFTYLFKVARILRQEKVDIIQPFLTPATFYGLLAAFLCRTRIKIVTERASAGRSKTSLGYRLYLKAEDLLSRGASYAVANSQAGAAFLRQRGINPARIKVIYNGLNVDRLIASEDKVVTLKNGLNIPPGGKVVGMMARMFPQKRHDIFLRAAAIVARAKPETKFALVGDGPLRSDLDKLSRELDIGSKVTFWGEHQDIAPYISALDIVVHASEAEGCSNSILEAMALGKPVVATDVGGNRELIESGVTGFLVPLEVQALAEAVLNVMDNTSIALRVAANAKRRVLNDFSMKQMVHKYESLSDITP